MPVDIDNLERLLRHYDYDAKEVDFLVDEFRNGFEIGYRGKRNVRMRAPNLKLECGTQADLWSKMMKEVKAKHYAGPFENIPFQHYIQSSVGLVPKSNGDVRLIFHLSYPRKGTRSVNACTPKYLCTVKYKDLPHAIKLCSEAGKGCFAAKVDMKSAFRNLPIKPNDWMLLVMMAKDP